VYSVENQPAFWSNMSSSSGSKSKPSKKSARSRQQSELCFMLISEDGGDMFIYKMSVDFQGTTWCDNPEGRALSSILVQKH
jgi:hypothetical protein